MTPSSPAHSYDSCFQDMQESSRDALARPVTSGDGSKSRAESVDDRHRPPFIPALRISRAGSRSFSVFLQEHNVMTIKDIHLCHDS